MIGKRLKLLREEMGLKQIDIAEMLAVKRISLTFLLSDGQRCLRGYWAINGQEIAPALV